MEKAILEQIKNEEAEMFKFAEKIVNIDSGYDCPEGVAEVAHIVGDFLAKLDFKVEYLETPNEPVQILATRPRLGKKKVMLMGHMDTVFPDGTVAKRPFTISDGKAYGPGVLDMKGGIVAFLYAIKALKSAGYDARPLKIILAGDEEVAHANSDAAERFVQEAKGCAAAFNCETGFLDDGIVTGRKGTAVFTFEVKGVSVHAGNEPENGRSAILEMAHKVIEIQKLTDYKIGITYNVGVIAGGIVPNAVPDFAKIKVDVRYIDPAQLPGIQSAMQKVADTVYVEGTSATVVMEPGIAPMQTTDGVKKLFEIVKKTYLENGWGNPYEKFVGGGSDSAYSVIAGVPTVCAMGVKGGRNHSAQEFAVVDTLFERAKLLAASTLNLDETN